MRIMDSCADVFSVSTVLSYFLIDYHLNGFSIGFPWIFYYEFYLSGQDLHHGFQGNALIYDITLTCLVVILVHLFFYHKKR